jgi:hypothetical protein
MKNATLILTVAALALLASTSIVDGKPSEATGFPYITSSATFPRRSGTPSIGNIVRHSFRLQIPNQSSPISQLTIRVPKGLKMPKTVTVLDATDQVVETDVAMNDRQITLTFSQPVAPGTSLWIAMNGIRVAGRSNGWLYPVSANFVGLNTNIPIGVARFRTGY